MSTQNANPQDSPLCTHNPKTKMTTQPDLIPTDPTPAPPLESARRRLANAMAQQREAKLLLEAQGPEAQPALNIAESEVRMAATEVRLLEKAALEKEAK